MSVFKTPTCRGRGHASLSLFAVSFLLGVQALRAAVIGPVAAPTGPALQYGAAEFSIQISDTKGDPFDARQAALDLVATSPTGRSLRVPGFWRHEIAAPTWCVRFTPQEAGTYTLSLEYSEAGKPAASKPLDPLQVKPSLRDGFLHPYNNWSFRFDSGRIFRGIGENVAWEGGWRDRSYSYEMLLGELSLNGANFYRTWMCYWNLPVEWKQVQKDSPFKERPYSDTRSTYNKSAVQRLDELVELNERLGLYMMFTIDWHGAIISNDKWPQYSYNKKNGGPCETPRDFFTHPEARALYKNRLRYLVARWGCSPSLACWEFFNEIDNTSYPENIPHAEVTAWHREMSDYLKQVDPYGRIVTTSVSHRDIEGMNDLPSIDLNQRHIYIRTSEMPKTIRDYVKAHNKPYVIGEGGYDWDWNKIFDWRGEEFDEHFKRELWYGLFSPTPVLPMSWWWEFFHDRKMKPYYRIVRAVHERMMAEGGGSFEELELVPGSLDALGVRCGKTLFLYVRNGGPESTVADLNIPGITQGKYSVEEIDTETSVLTMSAPLTAGEKGLLVPQLKLPRAQQRILVLRPLLR